MLGLAPGRVVGRESGRDGGREGDVIDSCNALLMGRSILPLDGLHRREHIQLLQTTQSHYNCMEGKFGPCWHSKAYNYSIVMAVTKITVITARVKLLIHIDW